MKLYCNITGKECTKKEYEEKLQYLHDIDVTNILETNDNTDLSGELACAGGSCEIV